MLSEVILHPPHLGFHIRQLLYALCMPGKLSNVMKISMLMVLHGLMTCIECPR